MNNVYEYIVTKSGIKYKDSVVIGVSGGSDSMGLLYLLNEIKKEMDLTLIVAHVNHNVRKESEKEKKFLKKWCDNNGIIFEYMKIQEYNDDNFHNEARTIRYNFFDKICKQYNSKFLLTAHHADDLIETILMRIVRGSTLQGYSGFQKEVEKGEYKIIRPFITITKEEILKYVLENKIPYVTDQSNAKDIYTRNRYRKYILPFLKNEDKNVHLKFLKFSETLIEYNKYIDREVGKIMTKVFKKGIINIKQFNLIDHLLQVKLIYNILEHIYGDDLLIISDTHVKLLFDLINSKKANSFVYLPNNVKAIKSYNELSFNFNEEEEDEYEVEISEIVNLPNGKNICVEQHCDLKNNNVIRLSSKDIRLPLIVRTRRNGDKIEIKGIKKFKKISDIFIDSKISLSNRRLWPIVTDSEGVIMWIPGLKKSSFDKEKNEVYDIILRYY